MLRQTTRWPELKIWLTCLHLQHVCRETDHGHGIRLNLRCLQWFRTPQYSEVRFDLELPVEPHRVLPVELIGPAQQPRVESAVLDSSLVPNCWYSWRSRTQFIVAEVRQLRALRHHVRILSSRGVDVAIHGVSHVSISRLRSTVRLHPSVNHRYHDLKTHSRLTTGQSLVSTRSEKHPSGRCQGQRQQDRTTLVNCRIAAKCSTPRSGRPNH